MFYQSAEHRKSVFHCVTHGLGVYLLNKIKEAVADLLLSKADFQNRALIHFLSILPTLHSQISHSVLE